MARALFLAFLVLALLSSLVMSGAQAAALRADVNALPSHREAFGAIAKSISDKIKHIIILMEENRSFDHMFGYYGKGTNGLTGKEYNLLDLSNPDSKKVYVDAGAPYINKCDPQHSSLLTTAKIYGNHSRAAACNYTCEDMSGFVAVEAVIGKGKPANNYCNVMQALNNTEKLPVLTALADEYVLMDRFFASVPGATWPNRLYHLSATSAGLTETFPWYENVPGKLFPQKTIFDQVNDVGGEWRVYYNDTPWEMFLETVAHNPEHLHTMTEFFADCQNGNLPDYAFINPRSGVNLTERVGSNDHHPDHDIRAGEQFYKDIYEALRASPQWNETLFIITYDEHGGFYDHVAPPVNIPDPDDGIPNYPDPTFKFDRLGIRIPTLLISPWVPKGLVVSEAPAAQKPTPTSEYDLTSIMASARKILKKLEGVPALTKRDAWASTFEHVLDILPEARADCPMHLPTPEAPSKWDFVGEGLEPINHLQSEILAVHHALGNPHEDACDEHPHHIQQQSQIGDYLQSSFNAHKERTLKWKEGKQRKSHHHHHHHHRHHTTAATTTTPAPSPFLGSSAYTMRIVPYKADAFVKNWVVNVSSTVPYMTIHGKADAVANVCLAATDLSAGSPVTINLCYPSNVPSKNRDPDQWWIVGNDATIRPYKAQHLCVTNNYFQVADQSTNTVYLDVCKSSVMQHYSYHGKAPGESGSGVFYYGDGATVLAAVADV